MNTERIKRNIRHVFLYPLRYILPDGNMKEKLFRWILSFQNSVPLYLAVNSGDVAIQVGTPNAYTVKRFSNMAGPNGKVIIIEADPENATDIKKELAHLNHKNVIIINKGAWSKETTLTFYRSDDFKGDHKIPVDGVVMDNDYRTTYTEKIEIPVDTLDNMLHAQGIKAFNYLSITVNGAEFEVLKGASKLIENSGKCRIFSKGHARFEDGKTGDPINTAIADYLQSFGCETIISKGEKSKMNVKEWTHREGDVFAWKK